MSSAQPLFRWASMLCFLSLAVGALLVAYSVLPLPSVAGSSKLTWFASVAAVSAFAGLVFAWFRAPGAAWLVTLLFLSGASQLWLSDAGWFKTFQNQYLGVAGRLTLCLIFVQGAVSVACLLFDPKQWLLRTVRSLTLGQFTRLGLLFGGLCLLAISIMPFVGTGDVTGYVVQFVIAGCAVAAAVAGIIAFLFASDLDQVPVSGALVSRLDHHAFTLIPLSFLVLAIVYSTFAFGQVPVVEDETAYLFQAKTIAQGAFHAPEVPSSIAGQMDYYLIANSADGWYATTVPGWSLILALGVVIGLPWLVNPVLGAVSVWLGMVFWRRVTNRDQAVTAGLLMTASPWLLEASASLMTHALVLALTLGSWCLIAQAKGFAGDKWRRVSAQLLIAGLLMGWIFFTRAVEGVLIGGLTGFWVLWYFGRQRRLMPILAYGLGCLITGSLYFAYNLHMTGDAFSTPLMVYLNESWGAGANAFGFGPDIGPPGGWSTLDLWPGHSLMEAFVNLANGLSALNTELLGWSMGSLSLLLIYVIWQRPRGPHLAMAILAAAVIVVHLFYWFTGTFYIGPRYWFGAFFGFVALSAGGFESLRRLKHVDDRAGATDRWHLVLLLLCGFSIVVFSTWRGSERYVPRTKHARVMASYQLPEGASDNSIVMLPCQRLFDGAMHRNDPFLRDRFPIFVLATTEDEREAVRRTFPERSIIDAGDLQSRCAR